ncbi:MAG: alpha/beta fold hydrolase [Alphaproteobacteria bacterium]|nr:alpha/beta fold hydrolase [Alphaproteobacteria bacterium]
MTVPDLLIDGPDDAPVTVVLAHGAGAPMDSDFMAAFADGLAARGLRCVRFEFPYMAERRVDGKKRPPNRAPALLDAWRAVIDHFGTDALVIGGKSMGGRMASLIARALEDEGTPVRGLVCLGYPFHPPGKPKKAAERLAHLLDIRTPTLILQGTRDTFGGMDHVPGLPLPGTVRVEWLVDGDHSFKPRKASGRTERENWDEALDRMAAFAMALA